MIPLQVPDLRGREREYLEQCVTDNWVSSVGPFVEQLEVDLAALTGRRYGVATVNGTAALQLSLIAAGITAADLVVVPDWAFAACANAVYHAGATPLFVDVEGETWSLDPGLLEAVLSERQGEIAAVLCVDVLGHPAKLDDIGEICEKAQVALIEDAAGAIGATYKGHHVGAHGLAACFSFNGNKLVTAGGGGMVVTDDETLASRIKSLSSQGRTGSDYRHQEIAWNLRLTNLNAAVALAQLERLGEMADTKRAIAARYDAAFDDCPGVSPMPRAAWAESNCWLYSLLMESEEQARALVTALDAAGIQARVFWRSLSDQRPYAQAPRRLRGVARGLSGRVVALPSSSNLSQDQQQRVIDAVLSFLGAGKQD